MNDAPRPLALSPAAAELVLGLGAPGRRRSMRPKRVGAKAAMLDRLVRDGLPVPEAWVLEAGAFARFVESDLPRGHDLASVVKRARAGSFDQAARAWDRLRHGKLPDPLRSALGELWAALGAAAPWGLAVRPSLVAGNLENEPAVGLGATSLGVRGAVELEAAVLRVWASSYLPSTLSALGRAEVDEPGMAVIVQAVVAASASGVLLTEPPPGFDGEHWQAGERLIVATLGLGPITARAVEQLVAPATTDAAPARAREPRAPPSLDWYRQTRASGGLVVAAHVVDKPLAVLVGPRGPELREAARESAAAPALSAEALGELDGLAARLESQVPGRLEVGFCVAEGGADGRRVRIVRLRRAPAGSRPIDGRHDALWTRFEAGTVEAEPAAPLTWSLVRSFTHEGGFEPAFDVLGARAPRKGLVTAVDGRLYFDLRAAFGALEGALSGGAGALAEALGAGAAEVAALATEAREKNGGLLAGLLQAPRLIARHAAVEREVAACEVEVDRAARALREMDLGLLPDDALATTLESARALLDRAMAGLLACAGTSFAAHVGIARVLERTLPAASRASDEAQLAREPLGQLARGLTGGAGDLATAALGIDLARVADSAADDPQGRRILESGLAQTPADLPEGALRSALEGHLESFGEHALSEGELASPRFREDPRAVLAMLASVSRAGPGSAARALGRGRSLADHELARLETRASGLELAIVRQLVAHARHTSRLRARMRVRAARVAAMLRAIALDVDRRLRRIDPLLPRGGVFFCTHAELSHALASGRAEVGRIARLRRADHERNLGRPDPPVTFAQAPDSIAPPPPIGPRLAGLRAGGGVAEGPARIVQSLADLAALLPGEVIVMQRADVGLAGAFLVAAALVTELGGPMSQAAVVTREYGMPAVVGARGATLALSAGERLRVDGDRGTIERLDAR